MPVFVLMIKAESTNVASIALPPEATYCISIKESAGSASREDVRVSAAEEAEIPGSRGTANFVIKWERDSRHAAHLTLISIADIRKKTPKLERDGWTGLTGFECRGMEPTSYSPEGEFEVTTAAGTKFEDVDLSEGEWAEYDEKASEAVEILKIEHKFVLQR